MGCTALISNLNPFFSSDILSASDVVPLELLFNHSSRVLSFLAKLVTIGCARESARKETPMMVSGRVVKTSICSLFERLKVNSIPIDLPIQFFCIVFTCSGQSFKESSSERSSSA